MKVNFILFVSDQEASTQFYERVLNLRPALHVPGMTEFHLGSDTVLGLMPELGIHRLLGPRLRDPAEAQGIARSELYLTVEDPAAYYQRALDSGAESLSELAPRDWGDEAAYCSDLDGHVVAFARRADLPG